MPEIGKALIVINTISFFLYGWDKLCSIRNWWRVRERTLLLFAVAFGSVGAFLAMQIFRHKTKHKKFYMLVPVLLIIQVSIILWFT